MNENSRIYVAGHRGLVGSALVRCLQSHGYANIIVRSHQELDLTRQAEVEEFFQDEKPEYVFLAAAKVGGIWANNTFPAEFSHSNLAIQTNVIQAAYIHGVDRLIFLGSSCIYPKECPQPIKEEYLLTGPLEPTNEPYAIAKIAGISQCEAYNRQYGTRFLAVMPTNLYGGNDNFDLETSHVLPALIRKFQLLKLAARRNWEAIKADEARHGPIPAELSVSLNTAAANHPSPLAPPSLLHSVRLWGTGSPRREFLHVSDLADACVFLMCLNDTSFLRLLADRRPIINIGCGEDLAIKDLAELIAEVVGYDGEIVWDHGKPDGTPRKLLDISRIKSLGWHPSIPLRRGINETYAWYVTNSS